MDILLLILLAVGFISGLFSGAVKQVISLVAFVAGFLLACIYYQTLGDILTSVLNFPTFCKTVAFVLLWVIVPIVLGFAANIATKALKGLKLGLPNSLLGALVSVVKYVILISCVLNVMSALHILDEEKTRDSRLFEPTKGLLSMIFSQGFIQADEPAEGASVGDTIWVER